MRAQRLGRTAARVKKNDHKLSLLSVVNQRRPGTDIVAQIKYLYKIYNIIRLFIIHLYLLITNVLYKCVLVTPPSSPPWRSFLSERIAAVFGTLSTAVYNNTRTPHNVPEFIEIYYCLFIIYYNIYVFIYRYNARIRPVFVRPRK